MCFHKNSMKDCDLFSKHHQLSTFPQRVTLKKRTPFRDHYRPKLAKYRYSIDAIQQPATRSGPASLP